MPPTDPFDSDPFAPAASRRPRPFTDQDEAGLLGGIVESSLGGLAYLGKLADKTFGARAVRGLLGGTPRELLSVLPFSDTAGLTRERDAVQGRDLLEQAGLVTPGDDDILNDIAGFGAEVALDPTLFVGAAIPRAVLGATGRGVNAGAKLAGRGLESVAGVNPYTYAGRQIEQARLAANTAFNTDVAETTTRFGQDLAREEYTPRLRAGRQRAEDQFAAALDPLDAFAKRLDEPGRRQLGMALYENAELGAGPATARLASLGFTPNDINSILGVGSDVAAGTRATLDAERAAGVLSKEFENTPKWMTEANRLAAEAGEAQPFSTMAQTGERYFPRTAESWDLPGDFTRGQRDRLTGVTPFQKARREEFLGLPGGTVGIDELVRNPELSGAGRTLSDLNVESRMLESLTGFADTGAMPPAWQGTAWGEAAWAGAKAQAKQLSDYLKALPDVAREKGMFNMDFLGNARARRMESARAVASADTVMAGLSPGRGAVRSAAAIQAAGGRPVYVTDVLQKTGLTQVDPAGMSTLPVSVERIAQAYNIPASEVRNLAVTEDVAADMLRMGQAWKIPESVAPVVDYWDRTTQLFKTGLTSPFPAFHARNMISGIFNMWRAGALSWRAGADMFRVLRGGSLSEETAARLFPGLALDAATRKFRELLVANDVAFTRAGLSAERSPGGVTPVTRRGLTPGDLPEVGGRVRPLSGDVGEFLSGYVPDKGKVGSQLNPLNTRGVAGEESLFIPARQGERLGNAAENWVRGTHFLGALLGGADPAAAKLSTMKYQIDYGDLTQFEQNVMRRIFPWYTFSRKNLPPLLEDLATNPAKVATSLRAVSGVRAPGTFVPPYVAEGASLPVPGAPEGQQRYVSSFGLPVEDELLKTIGAAGQGDLRRFAQQLLGMAQPIVKLPAEVATGTQLFSGRRLEELRPYEFSQLGGLVPEDVARQLSQVVANTPASRAASTLDKFLDERKGLGPTALNTLMGVKLTDVDVEKAKDVVSRKVLQDMLRGQPGVKSREEVYVPKANLDRLSAEDALTYDLLREIERRQLERARLTNKAREGSAGQR